MQPRKVAQYRKDLYGSPRMTRGLVNTEQWILINDCGEWIVVGDMAIGADTSKQCDWHWKYVQWNESCRLRNQFMVYLVTRLIISDTSNFHT